MAIDGQIRLQPLVAYGLPGADGEGDVTLLGLTAQGGVDRIVLAPLTASGAGHAGVAANAALTLRTPVVSGAGITGNAGTGAAVLRTLQASGGSGTYGAATLKALEASGAALSGTLAVGAITLLPTAALGAGDPTNYGEANLALRALQASSVLTQGNVGAGVLTLLPASASGAIATGNSGTGALLTLPLLAVSGAVASDVIGTASIELLPLVMGSADGSPSGVIAAQASTFRTLILNTRTRAASSYANFAFNSYARFHGVYLAAGSGGLFALVGDDDQGTDIALRLKGGLLDFGSDKLKRASGVYVSLASPGEAELTVTNEDGEAFSYSIAPSPYATVKQQRVPVGRGMKGRWRSFELANVRGAEMRVAAIAPDIEALGRRR